MLALGSASLLPVLDHGWIPHDEGTLAHSAERVLNGELPHRDFAEVYTGGLSYLHALGFQLFGIDLLSLRYVLFCAFLLWLPALYYVAVKLTSSVLAAVAIAWVSVLWSVPNYPAAMPSWYNLFLATGGMAALLAFQERARRRWVFLAGVLGGLSVLCKITGLFFVAAGLLFLCYRGLAGSPQAGAQTTTRPVGALLWAALALVPAMIVAGLVLIGWSRREWRDLYHFTLPGSIMAAVVGKAVWRSRRRGAPAVPPLVAAVAPYVLGVSLPVVLFVGVYVYHGAVEDLWSGLFGLPIRRLENAARLPRSFWWGLPTLLVGFLLLGARWLGGRRRLVALHHVGAILALGATLAWSQTDPVHTVVFASLSESIPLVTAGLGALLLRSSTAERIAPVLRERYVLVGASVALCSLVQYPFANSTYFCYVAPLAILAVAPLLRESRAPMQPTLTALMAFLLLFGVLFLRPVRLAGLAKGFVAEEVVPLNLDRGTLRVGRSGAEEYRAVVAALARHGADAVAYAGPDSPELYFLANVRNLTPAIFDFLVPDPAFHGGLVALLERNGVRVVAIRRTVFHSPPLEPAVLEEFEREFPVSVDIGRFTVRWKQ